MDQRRTDWSADDINGGTVLVAALLVGIGGLLAIAGLSVACAALVAASRRWYHRVDLPPHRDRPTEVGAGQGGGRRRRWRLVRDRVEVVRPRGASGRPPDLTDGRVLDLKRRSTRESPLERDDGRGRTVTAYAAPSLVAGSARPGSRCRSPRARPERSGWPQP